jgi:hypothetical protein
MSASGIDYTLLGTVTSDDKMVIDGEEFGKVSEAAGRYNSALAEKMA